MSVNVNRVILIGNLGADPEVKTFQKDGKFYQPNQPLGGKYE